MTQTIQTNQPTDDGISPNCTITNNSGKDVVVINAEDLGDSSPEILYEQTLTLIKLVSGGTVIKAGSLDTVVLEGTYVDEDGNTQQNYIWELIFADPKTLFPIANISVSPDYDATPQGYPPVTLTADDARQMVSASKFTQTISAFPNSQLGQDFANALKSIDSMGILDGEATMDKFFQGTDSFQNVDFASYLAASTYISQFLPWWFPPSTWVPFNTDKAIEAHAEWSYWLYSAANLGGGLNGATKASALGRVMFLNPPTGDPSDHNCGIKVYFTTDAYALPSATGTQLYFDNGQLVEQTDADSPQYCLQGLWATQSTFTGNVSDTALYAVLVGTINGTKVIGVPYRPEDGWDKFCSLWSGLTFDKVLNLFLTVMGVVMAIDFIRSKFAVKKAKTAEIKANENQGKPLTPEQEASVEAQSKAAKVTAETTANAVATRLGADPATGKPNLQVPTEDTLPTALNKVAETQTEANNSVQGDSMEVTLNNYNDVLTDLSQYPDDENNDLSYADGELKAAKDKLPDAVETGDFTEVQTHVNNIEPSIDTWQQATGQTLSGEIATSLETATNAVKQFNNIEETSEKASEGADGGDPVTEDGSTPDFTPVEG